MTNQNHEHQIMHATIKSLLAANYAVSVNDGEETTVKRSTDAQEIFSAMQTTDEDVLLVADGFIYFVYGNDGWDVINDYSVALEPILSDVNTLADKLSCD